MAVRWAGYLLIAIVILNIARAGKYGLYRYLDDKGFSRSIFYESPLLYTKSVIDYLIKSNLSDDIDVPRILIDIEFDDWKMLEKRRNSALEDGIIYKKYKKPVKASIRSNDRLIKTKVRLKGDLTDHLDGKEWSLRVNTRNNDHLFGMRSFSLQNPRTRGYIAEPLFLEMLKENGILAPRYLFVNEVVNGEDYGVMALEEHFSKEILEANGKKESVIIKLDETLYWESHAEGNSETYDDYTAAEISTFNNKKINKTPTLKKNKMVAVGLMRSFISGNLSASDVFDVPLLGRYLALADVWGAWHALRWHNLRFAFNPYTVKLEPIGYDAAATDPKDIDDIPSDTQKIARRMLQDGYVRLSYVKSIKQLNNDFHNPSFVNKFTKQGERYSSMLRGEHLFMPDSKSILELITKRSDFILDRWTNDTNIIIAIDNCNNDNVNGWAIDTSAPSKSITFKLHTKGATQNIHAAFPNDSFYKYNLDELGLTHDNHGFSINNKKLQGGDINCQYFMHHQDPNQAVDLNDMLNNILLPDSDHAISDNYKIPPLAFVTRKNGQPSLEIENIVNHSFLVSKIVIKSANDLMKNTITLSPSVYIPEKIKGIPFDTVSIDLSDYVNSEELSYDYSLIMRSKSNPSATYHINAKPYFQKLDRHPLQGIMPTNIVKEHPYISLNKEERIFRIQPGTYHVHDRIVIPAGYSLHISPATTLIFSPDTYILSFGSLISKGTENNPIIMKSSHQNKEWNGIIIIGDGTQTAILKNTLLNNTSSIQTDNWSLTGSLTVYRGKHVAIDMCEFNVNSSEDAINIIHSNFFIKNTTIRDSLSDAFDSDFSNGSISNSTFLNIGSRGGGDAIDISGSEVSISNVLLSNVNDKAISAGENSILTGDYLTITKSGIGVATKDGSTARISNSRIENSTVAGVMSYTKKPEYGASSVEINNMTFHGNKYNSIAQHGNQIVIDGKTEKTIDLNVKALYDFVTRPGL